MQYDPTRTHQDGLMEVAHLWQEQVEKAFREFRRTRRVRPLRLPARGLRVARPPSDISPKGE